MKSIAAVIACPSVSVVGGFPVRRAGLHRPGVLGREFRHGVGLAGQVADHPGVIHAVTGRRALRMVVAGHDLDRVVLPHLEHLLAEFGVAEALRVREAVVIDLGLRMVMRRIARPAAGQRHDFAEHQVHFGRRIAAVEDRAHQAQAAVADLAGAAPLIGDVGRTEHARHERRRLSQA